VSEFSGPQRREEKACKVPSSEPFVGSRDLRITESEKGPDPGG
jgi:hypothetical protein